MNDFDLPTLSVPPAERVISANATTLNVATIWGSFEMEYEYWLLGLFVNNAILLSRTCRFCVLLVSQSSAEKYKKSRGKYILGSVFFSIKEFFVICTQVIRYLILDNIKRIYLIIMDLFNKKMLNFISEISKQSSCMPWKGKKKQQQRNSEICIYLDRKVRGGIDPRVIKTEITSIINQERPEQKRSRILSERRKRHPW